MAATGTSSPSLLAHWPPRGSRGPRLRGEGSEGVRRGPGSFQAEALSPRGRGGRLLATETAPSAGYPGQCAMTRPWPSLSLLTGQLTVQRVQITNLRITLKSVWILWKRKVLQKFQANLTYSSRPLGCAANPLGLGVKSSETGLDSKVGIL